MKCASCKVEIPTELLARAEEVVSEVKTLSCPHCRKELLVLTATFNWSPKSRPRTGSRIVGWCRG